MPNRTNNYNLSEQERFARLRLARTPRVGPITFRRLLERFETARRALHAVPELARRGGATLRAAGEDVVLTELEAAQRVDARHIFLGERDYPAFLAAIDDAPPVLLVRGAIALLKRPAVAIVGARNASIVGCRFAHSLAGDLAARGVTVVSGLARGIDTAAHRGAGSSHTAAVVAGGVDVFYPPENRGLQQQIAQDGVVLSEQPPGVAPLAQHFPRRNRIVSGLAVAVAVVEATLRSGSLITARLALEQGREILAVPGFPTDPRASGPNALIRDGAVLIRDAEDVMAELATAVSLSRSPPKTVFGPQIIVESQLDDDRPRILARLGAVPVRVDELIRECQLSAPSALTLLLELELAGRLARHPGDCVSLLH
jgi:DNA processing protein